MATTTAVCRRYCRAIKPPKSRKLFRFAKTIKQREFPGRREFSVRSAVSVFIVSGDTGPRKTKRLWRRRPCAYADR